MFNRIYSLIILSFLFTGGCHHSSSTDSLPVLQRFTLSFVGTPGTPVLHVNANGHDSLWLVDTGTTNNLAASWFVRSLGVATTTLPNQNDGIVGVASPLRLILGALALKNDQFGVVNVPPELEHLEVGGIFSPQLMALPGTTVLINFKQSALSLLRGALDPHHDSGPGWSMAPDGMKLCPASNGDAGARYLVPAKIGDLDGWIEIASGAPESRLFADAAARAALPVENHVARGVYLQIGDGRARANLRILPAPSAAQADASCGAIGLLGMDVLRNCVIAVDGQHGLGRCWQD
jgi:hypothetical protein